MADWQIRKHQHAWSCTYSSIQRRGMIERACVADACHTISKERDTFISDLRQQQPALQACVLDVAAPHSHHWR
ncbi:hypothetical protein [Xanthomonas campestris]|uniref:hypothetical protein n=1 Tax=Xanthomonas campestris TaxID=339 RepID=UPI000E1E6940|nr:hypothetical protein [Xanthomonas campestris]